MRGGYRVYDADTHFQPAVESIVPYLDPDLRAREAEFEPFKRPVKVGRAGQVLEEPYRHWYRFGADEGWGRNKPRWLGEAGPREKEERHFQHFMGDRFPAVGAEDQLPDVRVKEMDEEGVDVQLLVPSAFGGHEDPNVDMGMIRALHRYLDDTCTAHEGRFTSLLVASARDPQASAAEIRANTGKKWAVGVTLALPIDFPVDHPDLHPIWEAIDEANMAVVHHSFASGYPGYRDLWDSPFIGRTASHPWGAMRMVAAFIGSGLMDRYANLRLSVLESGFGWIPFWARRMEDQVVYMGYVPELEHSIWEYFTGGRFTSSIVLHEGPEMIRMVNELMGDHVLMFGSDYPHAESRFPRSVDDVLGWELGEKTNQALFWDNAARFFAR